MKSQCFAVRVSAGRGIWLHLLICISGTAFSGWDIGFCLEPNFLIFIFKLKWELNKSS